MKIKQVLEICNKIKREKKQFFSNYYNKYNYSDVEFDVIEDIGTIVFSVQEEFIYRVYFFSNNLSELSMCLKKLPDSAVLDYVCKEDVGMLHDVFERAEWEHYATYLRTTVPIPKPPMPKTKLEIQLEKMYNPELGMLAQEEDIPAIRELMINTFDPINSEILTEQELRIAIQNETVWLYKVGEKICTLYIYQIQGRRRYGNMTYNSLSADYLYSITRKANDIANKKYNLLYHYGWVDEKNKKVLRTLKQSNEFIPDGTKNYIYIKKNKEELKNE